MIVRKEWEKKEHALCQGVWERERERERVSECVCVCVCVCDNTIHQMLIVCFNRKKEGIKKEKREREREREREKRMEKIHREREKWVL